MSTVQKWVGERTSFKGNYRPISASGLPGLGRTSWDPMLYPGVPLCRDGSLCPPGCCQRYQCCRPRLWRRDKKTSLQETGFASLQSLVCQSWLVKTRLHLHGRPSSRHQAASRREREAPWSRGVAKHARRLPAPHRGATKGFGAALRRAPAVVAAPRALRASQGAWRTTCGGAQRASLSFCTSFDVLSRRRKRKATTMRVRQRCWVLDARDTDATALTSTWTSSSVETLRSDPKTAGRCGRRHVVRHGITAARVDEHPGTARDASAPASKQIRHLRKCQN